MKLRISLVLSSLFLVYSQVLFSKDANWPSQQIYSGSHVNSATAHDYSGDGKQEILFSAEGKFFMYFGPKYDKPFIFAEATPKYAKMKGLSYLGPKYMKNFPSAENKISCLPSPL